MRDFTLDYRPSDGFMSCVDRAFEPWHIERLEKLGSNVTLCLTPGGEVAKVTVNLSTVESQEMLALRDRIDSRVWGLMTDLWISTVTA